MRTPLRRAWYAIRQGRCATDLAEEMEFHREMKLAELKARAVPSAGACTARTTRTTSWP
jgi:hypothetical protein